MSPSSPAHPPTHPSRPAPCSLGSPAAAACLLAACLLYYHGRARMEERLLGAAFGKRYERYRRATGRFLPRPAALWGLLRGRLQPQ